MNLIISNMEWCRFSFVKLETFFGLLILCVPLYAISESVGNALSYDTLLIELTKRLGNSNNYRSDASNLDGTGSKQTYGSDTNNQAKCEQNLRSGVIIKATESIKSGAEYIDSIKDVSSNDICTHYCCQNVTCDVAVYQDKGDRFCYLFKCDGKCIFKDHAGYYVNDVSRAKKLEQTTEEELHNLNNDPVKDKVADDQPGGGTKESPDANNANNVNKDPAPVKNVQEATSKSAGLPPTDPVITPHSVGLKGYCTQSMQCEDPNAACIDHNCYCKNGYYSKDGLCRKVCPPASFECFELGTLSRGPECVSREQVCDSYMHCADGSDEFNCENLVSSVQTNDLSRLASSSSQSQQPVQQPAGQGPAESSKLSQHQSPAATDRNAHRNSESKAYPPHQDTDSLSDQVSQKKNGISHVQKPSLPSSNDLGLEMSKNDNSKPNSQQPEKTNPETNSFDNTDNQLTYHNSNLGDDKSTNINNKNIENAHDGFSGHSANESPRQSNAHAQSQSKPAVNRNDVMENRTFDIIGHNSHNRIPPSDQDSQPSRSKVPESQENHYDLNTDEDPVHDHSDSLNSERPHSPEEDAAGNENSNKPYNKQAVESGPKKVPATVSHAAGAKPSHSNSADDEQSLGNLKVPVRLGPAKASHQTSSKSHASSVPSYDSQKWLDTGLYVPYGMSDASNQRQQPPQRPASSGQYFDSSQYYPPYPSDNLDTGSLLSNLGSPEDLGQYGGTYLERDKPLSNAYQAGSHNAGYLGFPDTGYRSQYPAANRYDYSGEYRSPAYHESDFYPAINSPQQYRPAAGLYEDFPSGQQRLVKPITNNLDKSAVKSVQPQSHGISNDEQNRRPKDQDKEGKAQSGASTASVKAVSTSSTPSTTTKPKAQPYVATTAKPSRSRGNEHVFLSSEKVIIASSSSNAEGPIIALSLGLAFTIILLALVVYRLRRMRHRLKKGRPLHQNEADYLINGMYL